MLHAARASVILRDAQPPILHGSAAFARSCRSVQLCVVCQHEKRFERELAIDLRAVALRQTAAYFTACRP